jgi:hypothetical protein
LIDEERQYVVSSYSASYSMLALSEALRALGAIDGLLVQAEMICDLLPDEADDDRAESVQQAYDTALEALEGLAAALRSALGLSV